MKDWYSYTDWDEDLGREVRVYPITQENARGRYRVDVWIGLGYEPTEEYFSDFDSAVHFASKIVNNYHQVCVVDTEPTSD